MFSLYVTWSGRIVLSGTEPTCTIGSGDHQQWYEPGSLTTQGVYRNRAWHQVVITLSHLRERSSVTRVTRLSVNNVAVGELRSRVDAHENVGVPGSLTLGQPCDIRGSNGSELAGRSFNGAVRNVRVADAAIGPPEATARAFERLGDGASSSVRLALEQVARRSSSCVPPRAIAATLVNQGFEELHAIQLRALPRCFVDRFAVLCSGVTISTSATCIPWRQYATSDLLQRDFVSITWARWHVAYVALTMTASIDAILWIDADLILVQNPWPFLPRLDDAFDIAYAPEYHIKYDDDVSRHHAERCADVSSLVAMGQFPVNLNTGLMLIRNASLVRDVVLAPHSPDPWEQPVANYILRNGWRTRVLRAERFTSFCHMALGRKLWGAFDRNRSLFSSDPAAACARLKVSPCDVVAMHANCAMVNHTVVDQINSRSEQSLGRQTEGQKWVRKRSKAEVMAGALALTRACRPSCAGREM